MIFDAHVPATQLLASEIANTFDQRVAESKEMQKWRRLAGLSNDTSPEAKAQRDQNASEYIYDSSDWSNRMRYDESETFELIFIEEILRKRVSQYRAYWKRRLFSGGGTVPRTFEKTTALVEFVAENPGAIGVVGEVPDDPRIRVIKIID